jgi:hypothetical protein
LETAICGIDLVTLLVILVTKCIYKSDGHLWLTPVTLAAIRRIMVQGQPEIVHKTLSRKKPVTKKGWWPGSR